MKNTLLLIEWAAMPKFFDWATVLYLVLHLGLLALAAMHLRARIRTYKALLHRLGQAMMPGDLGQLDARQKEVRGARMLFIALLLWEVVGSTILYFAGQNQHYW